MILRNIKNIKKKTNIFFDIKIKIYFSMIINFFGFNINIIYIILIIIILYHKKIKIKLYNLKSGIKITISCFILNIFFI